jgi:hypothetical protein
MRAVPAARGMGYLLLTSPVSGGVVLSWERVCSWEPSEVVVSSLDSRSSEAACSFSRSSPCSSAGVWVAAGEAVAVALAVVLAAEPEADAEEAGLEPLAVGEMHWVPSGVSRVGPPSQTSCEAPGVTVDPSGRTYTPPSPQFVPMGNSSMSNGHGESEVCSAPGDAGALCALDRSPSP